MFAFRITGNLLINHTIILNNLTIFVIKEVTKINQKNENVQFIHLKFTKIVILNGNENEELCFKIQEEVSNRIKEVLEKD